MDLAALPAKERLAVLMQEKAKRISGRKIDRFFPDEGPLRRELYRKHLQFFKAGLKERVRNAIAANRVGKTEGMGAYEMTLHLTGEYPPWWEGRRFIRPIEAMTAGDTSESTRDIQQLKLMGKPGEYGTGMIPAAAIGETAAGKLKDALDYVMVKHVSGGWSKLRFRSYEQGRKAFQGFELDVGWMDEEPPLDIYSEILTRTMTTGGMVFGTFTPLKGLTPLIKHCREIKAYEVGVTWDDVPHLTAEDKAEILKNTPEYLKKARSLGMPLLGSGAVFMIYEGDIKLEAMPDPIPQWWTCINGLDFGWDHPAACIEMWHDPEADVIYVTKAIAERQKIPVLLWEQVKNWNTAPWAWPHDGLQHDKGSGKQLKESYQAAGFPMLADHAKFDDDTFGVEAGILKMHERMETGRFKVLGHLDKFWEEFRTYHREDGVIVKEDDDVICAIRYALMCLRFASSQRSVAWARPAHNPSARRRNPLNV